MRAALVPAAGASSRMGGRDKLLEPVAGQPILRLVTGRAALVCDVVSVTLRMDDTARKAALTGLDVHFVPVPDADEGMAASLRAGAAWAMAQGCTALMVVLPDMPDVTQSDLRHLWADYARVPEMPLRATSADGLPGHPVILPAALLPDLLQLRGDEGARRVFAAHPPRLCPLPGDRAVMDLDTQADWAKWRARQHNDLT